MAKHLVAESKFKRLRINGVRFVTNADTLVSKFDASNPMLGPLIKRSALVQFDHSTQTFTIPKPAQTRKPKAVWVITAIACLVVLGWLMIAQPKSAPVTSKAPNCEALERPIELGGVRVHKAQCDGVVYEITTRERDGKVIGSKRI